MADVATDLLNKAKLSTSAQEKLFSLEQIKEVIFHRDPTLFPAFLEEITDFVVDKTVTVRKFLASFGGETLSKFPLHTPAILKMFDFLIRDESDSVVRAVVSEMARHFGRCAMYVVGQDTRSAKSFFAKSSGQLSPKDQWELLTRFTKTVVELLSSSRSAALRVQCIHYMSSYLLFSLPLDTFSQGAQKRAKTEHSAGRFQSPFNAASISLHHAFLSKDQIEAEAKTVLTRLALWATRGGPQGAPFTDEQMGELGVALAGVALERPRECRAILPAVTVLVLALNAEKPLELPAELRTSFVELAGELSEGIVSANHDDVEKKLKDALKSLQDAHSNKPIATTGAALLSNLLNMNEEFSSEEDEPMDGAAAETGDDVDDDDNDVRIRNRAIAAINSFETTTNGLPLKDREFVGSVAVVETQAPEVRNTKDTVLADDAPAFPDPPHVGPLWVVVPIGGPGGDVGFKAAPSATQVTPDGYFNLSMSHLHSMLQNGLQGSIKSSEKVRQ